MYSSLIKYLKTGAGLKTDKALEKALREIVSDSRYFNRYRHLGLPVYLLLDFRKDQILFISENIADYSGFTAAEIVKHPLSYWLKTQMPPGDFSLLNERIFPDAVRFIKALPPNNRKLYAYSFECRFRNTRGAYVTYLNKNLLYNSSLEKLPVFCLTLLLPLKQPGRQNAFTTTLLIEECPPEKSIRTPPRTETAPVSAINYHRQAQGVALNDREIKIIQFIARGLSSREIAEKICIGFESVRKYRKRIYAKLDIVKRSDLVAAAARLGIIT